MTRKEIRELREKLDAAKDTMLVSCSRESKVALAKAKLEYHNGMSEHYYDLADDSKYNKHCRLMDEAFNELRKLESEQ